MLKKLFKKLEDKAFKPLEGHEGRVDSVQYQRNGVVMTLEGGGRFFVEQAIWDNVQGQIADISSKVLSHGSLGVEGRRVRYTVAGNRVVSISLAEGS